MASDGAVVEEDKLLTLQRELKDIKQRISQESKKVFLLERDVRFLDTRIGLLINHRVSLEELIDRLEGETVPLAGSFRDDLKRQHYSNLFFLLQTAPEYLAKLTRSVSLNQIDGLLEAVMFSVYGNQYEPREEHLLLSMFETALQYEFQEATEFGSLLRANTAMTRMMTTYTRRGPGEMYLRSTLGDLIVDLAKRTDSLEINPVKVYEEMMEDGSVPAVHMSFTAKQKMAEKNATVRETVKNRVAKLEDIVDTVLRAMFASVDQVPYGIRWLCKAIQQLVKEHFPESTEENASSLIGGFYVLRFLNPSIVTPHAYRLLPHQPRYGARRNLTLVAKILQNIANQSHASAALKESYMQPLQPFIHRQQIRVRRFLNQLCDVPDFHESMQLEQYLALCQKTICIDITLSEIYLIHNLLVKYRDVLSSEADDRLNQILNDLGPPEPRLNRKDDVQLTLNLYSRWDAAPDPGDALSPSSPMSQSLFGGGRDQEKCRQLLLKLLQLYPPCSKERTLSRALQFAQQSGTPDVAVHAKLTAEQIVVAQEQCGLPDDDGNALFQECKALLPRRKQTQEKYERELASLAGVFKSLTDHAQFLNDQFDSYKQYLEAVRSKVGCSEQFPSDATLQRRRSQRMVKKTLTELERDGIVVESRGLAAMGRDLFFVMMSPAPGTYRVSMRNKGGVKELVEKTFHLEELLEVQHLQDPLLDLDGIVVLDARRTLSLLNKTFLRKFNSK
ncbi:uncharacterized protein [Oscarella lobularis]|uniref:uncharacterized protein isoform X2 n=1 Tax=Oscarella lobularis TaxID=121494 RepID=UPI00331315B7